jgi:hypothetical protein
LLADRHTVDSGDDELEAIFEYGMKRGWGDGLPIVPATPERVERMLQFTERSPGDVVGTVAPAYGVATVEKIAINAVMAGCKPAYLPVVIAAVEACCDPTFNLYGIQATTNPVAPMVLVNGPARVELGFNWAGNALGQGNRANATVGRALRLVLINVGGGRPGELDLATVGSPAKYTCCCAENEDSNPWEPYHVSKGFRLDQSTVTVFGIQAFHNIVAIGVQSGREILRTLGMAMAAVGTNNMTHGGQVLMILGPEHAAAIASTGLTRADTSHFLYEHARIPFGPLPAESQEVILRRRHNWLNRDSVTIADSPSDVELAVVGGAGNHSVFAPTFGATRSVTRAIDSARGVAPIDATLREQS